MEGIILGAISLGRVVVPFPKIYKLLKENDIEWLGRFLGTKIDRHTHTSCYCYIMIKLLIGQQDVDFICQTILAFYDLQISE